MRVANLAASTMGGAGRAALRLHQGLRDLGVESTLIVGSTDRSYPSVTVARASKLGRVRVVVAQRADRLPLRRYPHRPPTYFSPGLVGWFDATRHPAVRAADVVGLYWVASGFLSPRTIGRLTKPVVWRLSDQWPMTGGCHYTGGCEQFVVSCGACPQLASSDDDDLSRRGWQRRREAWRDTDLTIVAPSRWIADAARRSSLFRDRRIEVIPTGIDLDTFAPGDTMAARRGLDLPLDVPIVAFGSLLATTDERKGYRELRHALEHVAAAYAPRPPLLVAFGADQPLTDSPLPSRTMGTIADPARLAELYRAADVVVVPSRDDNLPNVALEASGCGAPVVAFDTGGMPDAVVHRRTGWLAAPYDPVDLAAGIRFVLDHDDPATLRRAARVHAAAHFALAEQADRFRALFSELASRAA